MENQEKAATLYDVVRYFDDHLSSKVQTGLSMEEAQQLRNELNVKNRRPYTSYEVRPSLTPSKTTV